MFGPLMHMVKSLEAESIIPGHCTSTVKRKLIKLNMQWYIGHFLHAQAGPGRFLGLTSKIFISVGIVVVLLSRAEAIACACFLSTSASLVTNLESTTVYEPPRNAFAEC